MGHRLLPLCAFACVWGCRVAPLPKLEPVAMTRGPAVRVLIPDAVSLSGLELGYPFTGRDLSKQLEAALREAGYSVALLPFEPHASAFSRAQTRAPTPFWDLL